MPGVASLKAMQYYAHPRNQFWRITGTIFGFDPAGRYEMRMRALGDRGVALWDVLASCRRSGSLDADIEDDTMIVNPFGSFLRAHPGIALVCFNGRKAEYA
ncbi:MAG: DNA-deoxyinosine glycosylase, partial [Sphingomonadaceae bacterium]